MPHSEPQDLTRLIARWQRGDADAGGEVISRAYEELHQLAGRCLNEERSGHTLQPTALVHEVYLRLVGERMPEVTSRSHLLGIASRLMRQILVNHALAKGAAKRGAGGGGPLDRAVEALEERRIDLVALDAALKDLAERDPLHARVVELRFFGGLTIEETAEVTGVSARKVVECWTFARAWLMKEMRA
ncbi:MAG: ECF-type sigma factor [Phycisphaerales bacterium]